MLSDVTLKIYDWYQKQEEGDRAYGHYGIVKDKKDLPTL